MDIETPWISFGGLSILPFALGPVSTSPISPKIDLARKRKKGLAINDNHLSATPFLFLLVISLCIGGCAYTPELQDVSAIPPTTSMAIDGVWKWPKGAVQRIEKGRVYSIDTTNIEKGRVLAKDVNKIGPGEYGLRWVYWDTKKRKTHFARAVIKITSPSHITLTRHMYTKPIKSDLAIVELDNGFEYLKEWEIIRGDKLNDAEIVKAYRQFMAKYPNSPDRSKAQARIDTLAHKAWNITKEHNRVDIYRAFISRFPDSNFSSEAKERLARIQKNRAVVEIEYPREIEATDSPYPNVSGPFWPLTIRFKETGGKTGYRLTQGKRYYYTNQGTRYGSGGATVSVKPGKSTEHTTWWSSADKKLCNARREVTWSGTDDYGNEIELKVEVKGLCSNY